MKQEELDEGLWRAVGDKSVDDVAEWIKRGANVKFEDAFKQTPLHMAAENGDTETCKLLISSGSDLTARDYRGRTPLHLGALCGRTETCNLLISSGSDLTARDHQENTPLHMAAENGDNETCKLLISSGSDLTARCFRLISKEKLFERPDDVKQVDMVAYFFSPTFVDKLMNPSSKRGVVDREDIINEYERNDTTTSRSFRKKNQDLQIVDFIWEMTPLHLGAWYGRTETCKLLISSGSDLTVRDDQGKDILLCVSNDDFVLSYPVKEDTTKSYDKWKSELSFDRYVSGRTPLHLGATYGKTETCKLLISSGSDLTARDNQGRTPLHLGASAGHTETCNLLISSGSDLTARDNQGRTPLHLGATYGNTETCKLFISSGSDLTARDNQDCTPLHYAAEKGAIEIVKNLLIYGADLTAKNKKGNTPLDVAELGHTSTFLEKIMNSNVPPEVYLLSSTDSKTFGSILKSGFYRSHVGKILIVGHEAVGKTAISNVLVGKVPSKARISTEGIEVHIYQAAIDLKNKKWIPFSLDIYDVAYRNLMITHKFTEEEMSILEKELSQLETEECGGVNNPEAKDQNERHAGNRDDTSSIKDESPVKVKRHISLFKRIKNYIFSKKITTELLLKETKARRDKVMKDEGLMPVNMMDFGGQYVFYSTHQSFLTYRGFYLLPVNGSLDFDEEISTESFIPGRFGKPTGRGFVLFWVGSITTCSVGASEDFPKIFVFLTHRDRIETEEEATKRAKYIFKEIRKMFKNTKAMAHLILEPELFINAMDPQDPDYRRLESTIVDHLCDHPTWGEKLPKAWIPLQLALQQNIKKGEKIMSMDDIRAVNNENPVQVLTEEELQVFLKMAHTQGEIIFFPLPGLQNKIIISPSFFVECLKSLVTESSFCSGKRQDVLKSVSENGVLRLEEIHSLWKKKETLLHHKDHLISVMVHLDILASPRKYNMDGNLIKVDYFFVPSLVRTSDENLFSLDQNRSIGLSFKFCGPVIPPAIGYRLIASCIDLYEIKRKDGIAMLFSGMAVLAVKQNLDLVVVLRNDRVDIYLIHNENRSKIVADTAVGIADCIRDILSKIVDSFKIMSSESIKNISGLQAFVVEYTCPDMNCLCYNVNQEEWTCQCGFEVKREMYTKWTTDKKTETCEADCTGIGEEGLFEKPSELQLAKLALQLAWEGPLGLKELLILLGLKENEMHAIEVDSNSNNLNTRFLCLRKWKLKMDGTIKDMYEAMEQAGNNLHLLCRMNRDRYLCLPQEPLQKKNPNDKDLDAISAEVITESLLLAVQLEVPASTWEQMKADNYKIVNINREILGKWRRESTGKNKMQQLAQALCNVGISITSILKDL